MIQQPIVLGLALCEQVITEEHTHNITLVNCFRRLKLRTFPSTAERFVAFAILTDGRGEGTLDLIVELLDRDEEIYSRQAHLVFTDPLQEIRVRLRLTQCSFPEPGRYQVTLLADGAVLAQRAFQVSGLEESS